MKLAVFPLEDIETYEKKGFVQKNYYNPNNMFDKIYIFNPSEPKELNPAMVQAMCGNAEYIIRFIGKQNTVQKILGLKKNAARCVQEISNIRPDCIRSYGMLFNTYIASECAEKNKIPLIISLHACHDDIKRNALRTRQIIPFLFYTWWNKFFESNMLCKAKKIIAVYKFAKEYALNNGADYKKVTVIYNKIDINLFHPSNKKFENFTVINVMRQIEVKNQQVLIKSVAKLKNVNLLLIGDGPEHKKLVKLAKKLKCADRIIFIKRVLNSELPLYYQKAHVFASSCNNGGVGIPILEALACGLPVIHSKYKYEENPDILPSCALRVNNTPESFADTISLLMDDKELYNHYLNMGLGFSKQINSKTMSDKEEKVYQEVIK